MRSTMSIEKLFPSYTLVMIGAEAMRIIQGVFGVFDARVDSQRVDGAMLSCRTIGAATFAQIDDALIARGMHRVAV